MANAEAADARSPRFELADLCEVEAAPPVRARQVGWAHYQPEPMYARSSRHETPVWMVLLDLELFQLHLLLRLPRQQRDKWLDTPQFMPWNLARQLTSRRSGSVMIILDLELFPSAALTARQVAHPASLRAALLVLSDAS